MPGNHDSRGQITILESALAQFHSSGLEAIVVSTDLPDAEHSRNLQYDWNMGPIRLLLDDGNAARALKVPHMPTLILVSPSGEITWRHDGFTLPGDLGLALRFFLGDPDYAQMSSE